MTKEESKRSTILEHQCQHLLAIKPTHCGNRSVEQRIRDLRFGIERIIEKTKYDEYGTFEDVRNRIIALASEVLAEDELPASEPWTPEPISLRGEHMVTTPAQEQATLALTHPTPKQITPLEMMSQVLQTQNPKDAVEVVKELAKLQMEMRRQDAEEAFNMSFASCQKEIRVVVPDASMQGDPSRKWATFKALDAAVRPIYNQFDFSISWSSAPSTVPDQMIVLAQVSKGLHTRHYQLPMDISGVGAKGAGVMDKPKAIGAGMSYAKRYLLAAIWNIPIGEEGVLMTNEFMDTVKAITFAFDKKTLWSLYNSATDEYEKDPQALKILNDAKRKRAKELGA